MRRAVLSAAVAAVVALVVGTVVVLMPRDAPAVDPVQERLPELIAFVEAERGLQLRRPIDVQILPDEQFVAAYRQGEGELPVGGIGATYEALGVADPGSFDADLRAVQDQLLGFYDGGRETLVVRQRPVDAYLDLILVHELTHVLQDQHFLIDRTSLVDSSERLLAFLSLVEGDAQRVERAWYDSRPAAIQAEIDAVDGLTDDRYTPLLPPDPIVSENDFPYQAGLRFVDGLLAQGGQERLDEVFRDPPRTSEQVLHPDALDDGPPAFPPAPEQNGELIDEGVLGERGLALLLGLDPLEGGPQEGWEGDSYRTNQRRDGQVCTAARVVMSSGPARDRLLDALQQVQLMATAEGTVRLRLSSCA